ncbi:glycosyltransferase family 4 protein [bacterium]|nr:glycosyltransferase family 4 protein [bacterium]
MKIYLSKNPEPMGGGVNSFARNFARWIRSEGFRTVTDIEQADRAIVFAHMEDPDRLALARKRGVRIVHRLDEDFEQNDSPHRVRKHEKIVQLNKLAHITVFQSRFVKKNVYPHVRPRAYRIIHNGADRRLFRPAEKPGPWVGHVTWSAAPKKRLDLLAGIIARHPEEKFLLVGRHSTGEIDFSKFPNVKLLGPQPHARMPALYRKMKLLVIPSERDPCPNAVVEAILSGVPVCHLKSGGVPEIVKTCGVELSRFDHIVKNPNPYRRRCFKRRDLDFARIGRRYLTA